MTQPAPDPRDQRIGLSADLDGQDLDAYVSRSPDRPHPRAVTVLMLNTYRHLTPSAARRFAAALVQAADDAEAIP